MISDYTAAKKYSSRLFWVATALSFVVVGIFVATLFTETCARFLYIIEKCEPRYLAFWRSPMNEIGDTLAGFASLLVLSWIVVSVIVQRNELFATVDELREAKHIEQQRDALKRLPVVLEKIRDCFFSLTDGESMYGGWRYRTHGSHNIENFHVLRARSIKQDEPDEFMPFVTSAVLNALTLQEIHRETLVDKPICSDAYTKLLLNLGDLHLLSAQLPEPERRSVRQWKVERARDALGYLINNRKFWKASAEHS
ncbi:hypothetical protein [Tateyamaria sp. SN3-11]|uniref:hypothetical protein n=1 Tax=Tateyamaria sp. SN3-11 TaxID=3092147 RepID=UPI0039E9A9CC